MIRVIVSPTMTFSSRNLILFALGSASVLAGAACGPPAPPTTTTPQPPVARDAGPAAMDTTPPPTTAGATVAVSASVVCVLRDQKVDCAALSTDATWDNQRALLAGAKKLPPVRALAMGKAHACALTLEGDPLCWGDERAVLGQKLELPTPRPVPGLPKLKAIVARDSATCGITLANQAICWGFDSWRDPDKPKPVKGIDGVEEIAVSGSHACGRTKQGQVFCWGGNWRSELGIPADHDWHTTAQKVALPAPARAVAVAEGGSCAVGEAGDVTCWGGTWVAKDDVQKGPPQKFDGLPRAQALALSRMADGCVVTPQRELQCWGDTGATLLVLGVKTGLVWPPRPLARDIVSVATSHSLNCFADVRGAVRCWGIAACGDKCEVVTVPL